MRCEKTYDESRNGDEEEVIVAKMDPLCGDREEKTVY